MIETRELKRIESAYFQKSLFFIYPLLGIPPVLRPVNTYLSWQKITEDDAKLICVFAKSDEPRIQQLEKLHLLANPKLLQMQPVKSGLLYVFDMNSMKANWNVFLNGEYSYLSPYVKNKVLKYYEYDPEKLTYAHCYLYPDLYYDQYADMLQVDRELFYEGTELISPPDLGQETCRLR